MSECLSLFVSCTKRKRLEAGPAMIFDNMKDGWGPELATEWLRRAGEESDKLEAIRLYTGAGWARVLDAVKVLNPAHWGVMSAGFGLIEPSVEIPPYQASFGMSATDQIGKKVLEGRNMAQKNQYWWRAINKARTGTETPIRDQVRAGEYDRVILCASGDYLEAIDLDIAPLAADLGKEKLIIICNANVVTRSMISPAVADCILPMGANILPLVGGAMLTVTMHTLDWLVREVVPHTGWDRAALEELINSETAQERIDALKKPIEDDALKDLIREGLLSRMSRTNILKSIRQTGYAVSQERVFYLIDYLTAQATGDPLPNSPENGFQPKRRGRKPRERIDESSVLLPQRLKVTWIDDRSEEIESDSGAAIQGNCIVYTQLGATRYIPLHSVRSWVCER